MENNVILDLLRFLGPEKANQLFIGEPIKGRDSWRLLDYIRSKYRYENLYEDESEEAECYIVVVKFSNKYIYSLIKERNESKGYLLEILSPNDTVTTIRLAKEEFMKCINKLKSREK
ncbi:hypothetical protein Smar_0521 [Staphylothermus marinus F1]|uniref:Uncharacterized protein n=1 Tax=Staphylothermus marinus (strain ATCC 43588 / DSM 3639 / JCM 9404 / F1) TaxID=399550 RepID=A3DLW9_STAMF|nr:hypothetical protein [Staphylothermus marinus]ABN69629.1 hypothetical protein Smar_0521 [Staphylothermus marinus F1]